MRIYLCIYVYYVPRLFVERLQGKKKENNLGKLVAVKGQEKISELEPEIK